MNPFEPQFEAENKEMLFTAHMSSGENYYDWYVDYQRNCVIAVDAIGEAHAVHKHQFDDPRYELSKMAREIWEAVDMAMFTHVHNLRNRAKPTPISPAEGTRLIDAHLVYTFKQLFPELASRRNRESRFTLEHYA